MSGDTDPDAGPDAALARFATELGDAVEATLGAWVEGCVARRVLEWSGVPPTATVTAEAQQAARRAGAEVLPELRALLATDVDEQRSTPLSVLRGAVPHPTAVLARAGVPPVERDELAERAFPEDRYDLAPGSFAALGSEVIEPGLHWGAAKAFVILRRRRGGAPR
ncbi:MAG: hypothetical protein GEV08_12475 [Acidimicrobiia bacterium]|nr:hypothetical protein [Acidimicrobiia bacterium]